jgi:hypothetical protein
MECGGGVCGGEPVSNPDGGVEGGAGMSSTDGGSAGSPGTGGAGTLDGAMPGMDGGTLPEDDGGVEGRPYKRRPGGCDCRMSDGRGEDEVPEPLRWALLVGLAYAVRRRRSASRPST